jgi:hypothetical protein
MGFGVEDKVVQADNVRRRKDEEEVLECLSEPETLRSR